MPIYKPSELHQFLESLGIAPKKGLSQNFLIDGNILRKIVAKANVAPGDVVVEVGPGPGSLTEQLLEAGARVIAVEKDTTLATALQRLDPAGKNLEVHCQDIMTFPLEEVLRDKLPHGKKAKVIANLPYHLTTPIIAQLVTRCDLFDSLTLMVQDEVAKRFTAKPKTSDYSSFTIFLNFYSIPHYAFLVNRTCFYPSPSVNSAIVVFELKTPPHLNDVDNFFKMTRSAFEHRRKMLRGSLKELYGSQNIEKALLSLQLPVTSRPEELSLEQFMGLYKVLRSDTEGQNTQA